MNDRDLLPMATDDPVIAAALTALKIVPLQEGLVARADHLRVGRWLVNHPQEVNHIGHLNRQDSSPSQTAAGPKLFHF